MGIPEADAGLMGGVGGLDELLRERKVVSDDDVDVLVLAVVVGALGFLYVVHERKTTPPWDPCQEKWRSRWDSNPR